jgi:hypothetical protein
LYDWRKTPIEPSIMRILDLTASVRRSKTVWLISCENAPGVANTGVIGINKSGRAPLKVINIQRR